jgi:hypothetical protein
MRIAVLFTRIHQVQVSLFLSVAYLFTFRMRQCYSVFRVSAVPATLCFHLDLPCSLFEFCRFIYPKPYNRVPFSFRDNKDVQL